MSEKKENLKEDIKAGNPAADGNDILRTTGYNQLYLDLSFMPHTSGTRTDWGKVTKHYNEFFDQIKKFIKNGTTFTVKIKYNPGSGDFYDIIYSGCSGRLLENSDDSGEDSIIITILTGAGGNKDINISYQGDAPNIFVAVVIADVM